MKATLCALALAFSTLVARLPAQQENYTAYIVETQSAVGTPLDGPVRLLRPNRTLVGEGRCVAGKLEGVWRGFLEKGFQISSVTFLHHELDGPVTIHHDPKPGSGEKVGIPSLTGTVRKAGTQFEGTVTSFRADGSKLSERTFDADGKLTGARGWKDGGAEMDEAEARRVAEKLTAADLKFIGIMQTIFRNGTREGRRTSPAP